MRRLFILLLTLSLFAAAAVPAAAQTRALLVACSDFVTQPDLGSAISGNLNMIGSALLGAEPPLSRLSIEDGTIATPQALHASIDDAFADASQEDLSILYLCTHGTLSSDDQKAYLILGDGETESLLTSEALYEMIASIPGEKLLILDACFSGAYLGRGHMQALDSPFASDARVHVVTSASPRESSWYYDSEKLLTGAVSYFASALSSGLGLYGRAEADLNSDGSVSLSELHRHLSTAVPSSSSQLLSARPEHIFLPAAKGAMLHHALSDFSYGSSLLLSDDPTLHFSFTAAQDVSVQYRLVEYENGSWNWAGAQTFLDGEEPLRAGRHSRSLTLPQIAPEDRGYLMLQVFSVSGESLLLCSERLIAVQPSIIEPQLELTVPQTFSCPGAGELPIRVSLGAPAEITLSVYDSQGTLIRRLAAGTITRPGENDVLTFYWDGRDESSQIVPEGAYTLRAETFAGFKRIKAEAVVTVVSGS